MRARSSVGLGLASLVVLAGCNIRQQIAGGGVVLVAGGLVMTYSGEERSETSTVEQVGIGMLLVGLATLFTAAALDEAAKNEDPPQEVRAATATRPARPRGATPRQLRREQAWQLTRQAQLAAREGDCPKVALLAVQVGEIDPELYGSVFVTDIAVAGCLAPAPAPAADPEPSPPSAPSTIPSTSVPMPSTAIPPLPPPVPVPAPEPAP